MPSYLKVPLSNSVNGRQIPVTTTSGSYTTIHTAVSGSTSQDEVYLYAYNDSTASVTLSLLWGSVTESNDVTRYPIPAQNGRELLVDGKMLSGQLSVQAYSSVANTIMIDGFVNRILDTSVDPIVASWAQRVAYLGGPLPTTNTQQVLTTFMRGLESNGLLAKMIVLHPIITESFNAAITPLIRGICCDPFQQANGMSSASLNKNGIAGNGTNQYLLVGTNLNFYYPNFNTASGITWYVTSTGGNGFDLGAYSNTTNTLLGAARYTDGLAYAYNGVYNTTPTNLISASSPGNGYYSNNRISATDHRFYFANSTSSHRQIGLTDSASFTGTLASVSMTMCAVSFGGTPQLWSTDRISFMAVHIGLQQFESQILYTLVQSMMTSLGGGFV